VDFREAGPQASDKQHKKQARRASPFPVVYDAWWFAEGSLHAISEESVLEKRGGEGEGAEPFPGAAFMGIVDGVGRGVRSLGQALLE